MDFKQELQRLRKKLIQASNGASTSKLKKLANEFLLFNDLCNLCHCEYLHLPTLPHVEENTLIEDINLYYYELEDMAEHAIDTFKNANFYDYKGMKKRIIPMQEQREILSSFFQYFIPSLQDIYCDLVNMNHVFDTNHPNAYGQSILMPSIDSYFFAITYNDLKNNSIAILEVIVHELMHIYTAKFFNNYSSQHTRTLYTHLCSEAVSYYIELSFYHFCKKNHFYSEIVDFNRNQAYADMLSFYKMIRYVYAKSNDPSCEIISDGINYEVIGNPILEIDSDMPFFQSPSKYYQTGNFVSFISGVSFFFSLSLLEQERAGENIQKSINQFLLEVDENTFLEAYQRGLNYDLLEKEIKFHQQELKKNYPIPGYSSQKR